jgi:hypothetical protein
VGGREPVVAAGQWGLWDGGQAEEAWLFGGPVLLLDWFFFAFFFLFLLSVLVIGGRAMTARFHSQQEWENLQIDPEGGALE